MSFFSMSFLRSLQVKAVLAALIPMYAILAAVAIIAFLTTIEDLELAPVVWASLLFLIIFILPASALAWHLAGRTLSPIGEMIEDARGTAEENAAMAEIGRIIGSTLDIGAVYDQFAAQTKRVIRFDSMAVMNVYARRRAFAAAYMSGVSVPNLAHGDERPLDGTATGQAFDTARPVLFQPDSRQAVERDFPGLLGSWDRGLRSFIAVPLASRDDVIGILWTASLSANAYGQRAVELAEKVASHISGAVANAQLYEETQRFYAEERRRADFFQEIAELSSIMSSTLDLDDALSRIVRTIRDAFDCYHVGIGLIEGEDVIYKFGAGATSDNPSFRFDPARLKVGGEGLTGWVAQTGEPILAPDVSRDPRYVAMRHLNTKSELVIPIRAKGEVIGVLDLQSDRLNAFDDADLITMQSLANEAGVSIENARLFEAERRRNERMAVINAVALNVSAVLTLGELLPHVAQLARETFGYHAVGVFLMDESEREVVLEALDSGDDPIPPRGTRMAVGGEGIVGHVADAGLPWITGDVSSDPFYSSLSVESGKTKSELAMPIKQGDIVVGVLDFHSERPDAFDDSDMLIAQTLANQLAVAIENARIFDETRDLAVLEERNRMAREIHDTLAQGFTGIVIQLEAGEQAIESDMEALRGHVGMAKSLARECLAEARRSVWNLLPQALEENPLDVILQTEVERFGQTSKADARFTLLGMRRQLPAVAQAALMRICQESLSNIGKYANADRVDVTLDFALNTVTLTVADDGAGFDPDAVRIEEGGGGFGIIGMRQRARLLRGDVAITSAPGEGAKVEARIPIG